MKLSGELHRYFLNNGGQTIHKWFHYFDIYERHFSRFRDHPVKMLEIGVFEGGSLKMWQSYFHPDSTIVGVDIRRDCKSFSGENIHVMIGSQDDEAFLQKVLRRYGPFDIVLDDGSHQNAHVIKSFEILYPQLHETGVYMVEDAHTSYMEKFGGGLRREGSMIEMFKMKIDELNAVFAEGQPQTDFTRSTDALCFYDSVIVIEKRPQGKRNSIMTHAMGAR